MSRCCDGLCDCSTIVVCAAGVVAHDDAVAADETVDVANVGGNR